MIETTPTIEVQIAYLLRNGWTRVRTGLWKSPAGVLFRGPHGAWKVATSRGKGKSLVGLTIPERGGAR